MAKGCTATFRFLQIMKSDIGGVAIDGHMGVGMGSKRTDQQASDGQTGPKMCDNRPLTLDSE